MSEEEFVVCEGCGDEVSTDILGPDGVLCNTCWEAQDDEEYEEYS